MSLFLIKDEFMKKNEYDILKQAQHFLENKNYKQAIEIYEKNYIRTNSLENNYLLFHALLRNHDWDQAILVANDYLNDYIEDDVKFYEYFNALLHAGKILTAFKIFQNLKCYLNDIEKEELIKRLKNYPAYLTKQKQQKKKEILRKLKYLPAFDPKGQQLIIKQLELLSPQELNLNTKSVLLDENVLCLVRMTLLDTLRQVSSTLVKVRNFKNEVVEINLATLKPLEQFEIFNVVQKKILESKNISENLKLKILSETKTKLMILYSDLDKLDVQFLVNILLNNKTDLNKNEQKVRSKIENELNKLDYLQN